MGEAIDVHNPSTLLRDVSQRIDMTVNGKHFRTIWIKEGDRSTVQVINQQKLPHGLEILDLRTVEEFRAAIQDMTIRGAGLIGATAGYGLYIAALTSPEKGFLGFIEASARILVATRPTASNLAWALNRQLAVIRACSTREGMIRAAFETARDIADEDAEACRQIGEHGKALIMEIAKKKPGETVHILTHCNAGWLAFVDYGSATAPIYSAFGAGVRLHVWVDETRPRNQGASLTAWELGQHGVPHDLIADNAGGHLMQHGLVDLVITGADRVTRNGDVANKIGTYLKAAAAKDCQVPFYVALPSSTFDFERVDGVKSIPIEERASEEVRFMTGKTAGGKIDTVQICPDSTPARNWGFDVTPARLVTRLICERGICEASEAGILGLFPEKRP
jgi:methylthioribose-1-phosphate isomerase